MGKMHLSAAIQRFLTWANVNRQPKTVRVYRHYLERFLHWKKDCLLSTVTPTDLTTWSQKFHAVQAVQRLFAWCTKLERSLKINPVAGMEKIPTGSRHRILDNSETVALLRGANGPFRRLLFALRETFARPAEMRLAKRGDVRRPGGLPARSIDLAKGLAFFLFREGKGFNRRSDRDAVRLIPISPRLGRLLVRLLAIEGVDNAPLFKDSKGLEWTGNAVRCRMRRLRNRVGLVADWRGEKVVAYSFRHTGATRAVAAGIRDFQLAEVMGHANVRTTKRYVHLQPDDLQRAMGKIWEFKPSRD